VPILSVASQEQAWNRVQLQQPVAKPCLRLWQYEQPAIVLGCSQRSMHERFPAMAGSRPMEVLLRESGGGAVLTGPWMLGLSLALPIGHPWLEHGLHESYRPLGQLYAEVMTTQGVRARALPPAAAACAAGRARRAQPARARLGLFRQFVTLGSRRFSRAQARRPGTATTPDRRVAGGRNAHFRASLDLVMRGAGPRRRCPVAQAAHHALCGTVARDNLCGKMGNGTGAQAD